MKEEAEESNNSEISVSASSTINLEASLTTSSNVRIVRELKCPKGSTAVTYTDDLQILACGQEDGSILLFNNNSEPRTLMDYELTLHDEPCTDLTIKSSPKGGYHKTILAGYLSGHIKLWDTNLGKVLFTLKENRHLYGLRYHPRSHRFLSVGNDFKVNVYDEEARVTERVLSSSQVKGSKNGHTDSVCSAAFHPKNPFEVISGGVDNTIQFWDMRAPFAIRRIEGVTMYGDSLDITKDGKAVVCGVAGTWDCPIHVYDYDTGKLLRKFAKPGCFVYSSVLLSPVLVGIGGFCYHTFRIINLKTSQVYGYVNGLPGCVMNSALRQKVPRYRTKFEKIPTIALSSKDRIIELEVETPEDAFETADFYYQFLGE